MATTTQKLAKHDGGEAFVCKDCMVLIDPVGGSYPGYTKEECDNAECPHCGGTDTAWSFVDVADLEIGDLWLDANQGKNASGNAFGYIGTNEETIDDDGVECEYCGWFFDWPSDKAKIATEAERQAVIDSLELDETANHLPHIDADLAIEKLTAYLGRKFPEFTEELE